jgi:putative proteasome-type protease
MTFCLAMRVQEGLVGIADTRVTTGSECITARKVSVYHRPGSAIFLMTSGLRSVRDKTLTYFDEVMEDDDQPFDRLFKVVNAYSAQLRRVSAEDRAPLEASGLRFDVHALIGGQCEHDKEHKLYLIYPQGNWVDIGPGTPYHIIGASGYGKPVLDRTLHYDDPMRFALKVGCLAFDSTRISAADVDFPIDVTIYPRDSYQIIQHRYEKQNLESISRWWQDRLRGSIAELPSDWIEDAFEDVPDATHRIRPMTG